MWLQYPPGTSGMCSYIESRGGEYPETVFFGLQYILKEYLVHRVTVEEVEKAKILYEAHGEPFNYDGWMHIAKNLDGRLPIRIRAVAEGSVIPTHNALVTIESTGGPETFWVVTWLEDQILRVWYPTTVATRSRSIKKIVLEALRKSSDDPENEINFKLHDFGSRGVSSQESAMIGGAAHLVNFMGSDTVVGVLCANEFYNIDMAGFSIPAAEHSTITSWGKKNEVEAYRNMIKQFSRPGNVVACVSDSYDLWNACANLWGTQLKQEVIGSGGIMVIRPDSGHPPTVVLKTIQILEEKFGVTINTKGYKVLNHVRVIQGDGINDQSIQEILNILLENGYSATNIAFGMGGALLQQLNRDTQKFAMKCSSVIVDGEYRDVFKDPITDTGKRSKAGRLDTICVHSAVPFGTDCVTIETVVLANDQIAHPKSIMRTVFENGELLIDDNFAAIRERAKVA
jgi:nicotinamide phosphoribosyltransferase